MTKEKLAEILRLHKMWLDKEEGGERADLRSVNLRNLSYANLSYADLSYADLSYADFGGVNLRNANLRGAELIYANLHNAILRGANLRNANLRGAELRGTYLGDVDLRGAELHGVDLNGASLCDAKTDKKYIQIACIGSRKGITTYCIDDNTVLCGCWNNFKGGTLEDFEKRVNDAYGDGKNDLYFKEYIGFINYIKFLRGE